MKTNKEYEVNIDVPKENIKVGAVEIEFDIHYKAGHTYQEKWIEAIVFCPACGTHKVFINNDPGDYYLGVNYHCSSCGSSFNLNLNLDRKPDNESSQRQDYFKQYLGVI